MAVQFGSDLLGMLALMCLAICGLRNLSFPKSVCSTTNILVVCYSNMNAHCVRPHRTFSSSIFLLGFPGCRSKQTVFGERTGWRIKLYAMRFKSKLLNRTEKSVRLWVEVYSLRFGLAGNYTLLTVRIDASEMVCSSRSKLSGTHRRPNHSGNKT